ncbi:MAG: septum formation initiator family protein [Candidatus Saccharimonadales bacterium]|jgi:cell division protein FtsB
MNISHYYQMFRRHATLNNGVLAAAAIIVLASVWNTVETLQKNFLLQQRVDTMKQEIAIAEIETETLKLQQQYLKSTEYQELTARAKLGKSSPGEKVIILPPLPKSDTPQAETPTTRVPRSNFAKWTQFFFGR